MHSFNLSETLASYLKFARRVRLLPESAWTQFGEQNEQVVLDQLEQVCAVDKKFEIK